MNPRLRFTLAILLPFVAAGLQWLLWDAWIKPYVWFLFFPVAFFSAWLAGLAGGIAGTAISALLVWYLFIPPKFTFVLENPATGFSIAVFVVMGVLFAWFHEKLNRALRSSESRFEATFEQAAVGIALVAPNGRWLKVNRRLCTIIGYTAAELMRKTFQEITHPDDLAVDLDQVGRMLKREIDSYTMEKRYFHKDGHIVWIELTVSLVWTPDGKPDYFISVIEDISAKKTTEAALLEGEGRFRELFERAPIALATSDRDGLIVLMNQAFVDLFGYRIEQIPTVSLWRARTLADAEQAVAAERDWNRKWETGTATGSPAEMQEHRVICADGRRKTVLLTRMRLGQDMLLAAVDISARKAAEEEIYQRNTELERFDRASVGRELEMIRLKREVNALAQALGRQAPYDLRFADTPGPGAPAP